LDTTEDMLVWIPGVTNIDRGKDWDGEDAFIIFNNPYFVRGMRFVIYSNEPYVGIEKLIPYRKEWTV